MHQKMVGFLLFRWNYACAQTATCPKYVVKAIFAPPVFLWESLPETTI